jgi:hypothetical protein
MRGYFVRMQQQAKHPFVWHGRQARRTMAALTWWKRMQKESEQKEIRRQKRLLIGALAVFALLVLLRLLK